MTAAAKREQLEALIRLAVTRNGSCTAKGKCAGCESNIADALAAADLYAAQVAAGSVKRVTEETAARLTMAAAEAFRASAAPRPAVTAGRARRPR